jgi:hypothetical protein
MLLIRDIMHCKPGKVRPLVEKFVAMSKLSEKVGMGKIRVTTDVCTDRFWTVVIEFETSSLKHFEEMMVQGQVKNAEAMKEMEALMKGYHEFVDSGRREIYKIEG